MHFILLDDSCLAEGAEYLQIRLPLFNFKLLDGHVSHVYYHYVVAQICLVEADLSDVKFSACLFDFGSRDLLLLLGYEVLSLTV